MEVRFSPPNLKRIGYPKNTIYMRMAYAMSELLRWSIENTSWNSPVSQCRDNSNILKQEIKEKK